MPSPPPPPPQYVFQVTRMKEAIPIIFMPKTGKLREKKVLKKHELASKNFFRHLGISKKQTFEKYLISFWNSIFLNFFFTKLFDHFG